MNIDVASKLRTVIKKHEGFRKFCYQDSRNCPTIGYGRNLRDVGISESEADFLLYEDINVATQELYRLLPVFQQIDDVRKAVLVEMTFNMGIATVLQFKRMIAALEKRDYKAAAEEMLNSEWAKQVKTRAHEMAQSMEMGVL